MTGASGQLTVRADSAFYSKAVLATAAKFDVRFSITARQDRRVRAANNAIDEAAWQPSPDPLGVPAERLRAVRSWCGVRAAAHRDGQGLPCGMGMGTLARRREHRQVATHQLHSGTRRYISPVLARGS